MLASVFHLTDRGRIAKGLRADLLLVKGDPTRDVTATRAIVAVWKLGVPVDREEFRTEIARTRTEVDKLRQAPPPAGSASGLISDFEDGKASTAFGAGWSTIVGFQGGASKASMKVVEGGGNGSRYSLNVSGEIVQDVRYPVAGVMFSPGARPSRRRRNPVTQPLYGHSGLAARQFPLFGSRRLRWLRPDCDPDCGRTGCRAIQLSDRRRQA